MNSHKCSTCGFVNFVDAAICKRCKRNLITARQGKGFKGLSTSCPCCDSSDTQSFEMAYQTGTSFGQVQTTSYNHELGMSVGSARTSNQTVLASTIRPPAKPQDPTLILILAYLCCIWIISIYLMVNVDNIYGLLFGVISTLLVVVYILASYKQWSKELIQKQVDYKRNIGEWLKSWICLRCGSTWKL